MGRMWAAASIGLSAGLYLLDFGTNINTLRTYYHYQHECPHAPLASPLLRDPVCRAIRFGHHLHSFATEFWVCISILGITYLTYAFIFWVTLDSYHHPFRLAYFMPLIHLYRLLKLFYHTFSCKGIKKLREGQRECSSLYNVLGAALETAPQFTIQLHIAMKLGEYIKGTSDPNMQAQRIPTSLLLSLVVSIASGVYSASVAVLLLMDEHMPLARKVCLYILVGCQTLVVMIVKANLYSAFAQLSDPGISIILFIYSFIGVTISWAFCGLLLQTHCDYCQGKKKLLRVAHSFGLALINVSIGPIYVIVKFKKYMTWLIWGILSHIFVDVIGLALIFLQPGNVKKGETPCHPLKVTDWEEQRNQYLNCQFFLGTTIPSLFLLILITMLFIMFHPKGNKSSSLSVSTSRIGIQSPEHLEGNQQSISSIFKLLLLFLLIIIIIKKLPKRLAQKASSSTK